MLLGVPATNNYLAVPESLFVILKEPLAAVEVPVAVLEQLLDLILQKAIGDVFATQLLDEGLIMADIEIHAEQLLGIVLELLGYSSSF